MKNNIKNIALAGMIIAGMTSCGDYLDTDSVSTADEAFVFSTINTTQAALDGAYSQWHDCISSQIFGDGLYYALDMAGSDIMRHPEGFANQLPRHQPESFYLNGTVAGTYNPITYGKEAPNSPYAKLYVVISRANSIIDGMEKYLPTFADAMAATGASDVTEAYGEAVCMRATAYRELIKYYGDVPYYLPSDGNKANGLASRDYIYDVLIKQLQEVAPKMRPVAANNKGYFSQTYAYALIGRLAIEAAGYQTRRPDINYVDGDGNALTFETKGQPNANAGNAYYARRSDYKKLYEIAKDAYEECLQNLGAVKFDESDYSTFFTQLHKDDKEFADESIFEEPFTQGASGNDPRPYSLGRPSGGGSSKAYPCKSYGQGRINPAFYYGMFDPNDVRRDISCSVTGSDGKGYETLIPFTPGSTVKGGGIACGKFDENRQTTVWTANQRRSGVNAPYMRISEVYLGLAEAYAVLGDEAKAKEYLAYTRTRAMGTNDVDEFVAKEGDLFKAVIDERGFEFAGEGDRRWTLIRSGLIAEKIKEIKELTKKMIDGLEADGSYTFENGNVISSDVYTKAVDPTDAPYNLSSRVTPGICTDKTNPVLFPAWRGQHDWENVSDFTAYSSNAKSNLAIKGLFAPVDDAAALTADGYKKVAWGSQIVANKVEYLDNFFPEYDYVSAPIYLFPFSTNAVATAGILNGFGFGQAW